LAYLLADHTTGSVLRLTRAAAISYNLFARAALGDTGARAQMTEEDAKTGFMTLHMATQVGRAGQRGAQWFNPLSIHLELFDVGPFQRHLPRFARATFGPLGICAFALLTLIAVTLGMRNDWSAATAFKTSMTIEAFLIFGIFAPFLKLIHELGHVLAATLCNVRVRMGGVNLIAFFPLPFVDCSAADLTAQRWQRVLISAAGVLTDFTIGLVAFCLWHIVENKQIQDILGYIFVFSTLNSLLFNANPLMRLDGYFVVSDLLGRRNMGTDAAAIKKSATEYLGSFGTKGALPNGAANWGMLAYGVATGIYKVLLLIGIMWVTLPQFFGIGIVMVFWAFWAMFGAKWMGLTAGAAPPVSPGTSVAVPNPVDSPMLQIAPTSWISRLGRRAGRAPFILAALVIGIAFIPVAPRVIVDMRPDMINHYNVTTTRPGILELDVRRHGSVIKGDVLTRLRSADFADASELANLGVAEAQIINAISQNQGAAQIKAGADRVAGAQDLRNIARKEQDELVVRAPMRGVFTAAMPLPRGSYVQQGSVLGSILPPEGQVWLTGVFPENYVIHYDRGISRSTLWAGVGAKKQYRAIDATSIALIEEVQQDATTLSRGFTLQITTDAANLTRYPQIRLAFAPISVWRHVTFWANRKLAQFRDAQLAETERRIEN
jgi:hypothetical protein